MSAAGALSFAASEPPLAWSQQRQEAPPVIMALTLYVCQPGLPQPSRSAWCECASKEKSFHCEQIQTVSAVPPASFTQS
eukprot:1073499-Pelagomonas_calceolata.AAC.4